VQAEGDPETPDSSTYRAAFQSGIAALLRGDGEAALAQLELAADHLGEHPQAELARVRAVLLTGDFRQTMAWATLLVGEHPDFPAAPAWLAWLLDRAGNTSAASATLEAALARWPNHPTLVAARCELLIDRGNAVAAAKLLDGLPNELGAHPDIRRLRRRAMLAIGQAASAPPIETAGALPAGAGMDNGLWPAPYASRWPGSAARLPRCANAFLLPGEQELITDPAVLTPGTRFWVRDAFGVLAEATPIAPTPAAATGRLRLASPWRVKSSTRTLPHPLASARNGTLCFVLGHPVVDPWSGALPAVEPGVVVRASLQTGAQMQLSMRFGVHHPGSPVFDGNGHLIGLVKAPAADGADGLLPGAAWSALGLEGLGGLRASAVADGAAKPDLPGSDELYESLLPRIFALFVDA
jgi:hypothetical protein